MLCHQTLSYNTLKLSIIIKYIMPITWLIGIRKKIFSSKFWKKYNKIWFPQGKGKLFCNVHNDCIITTHAIICKTKHSLKQHLKSLLAFTPVKYLRQVENQSSNLAHLILLILHSDHMKCFVWFLSVSSSLLLSSGFFKVHSLYCFHQHENKKHDICFGETLFTT